MSAERIDHGAHEAEIRAVLERLTAAWRQGDGSALADILHEHAVIVAPGLVQRIRGRSACAQSYEEFVMYATIHDYTESELVIDSWGNTAVATYRFDMSWTSDGQEHHETGHDVLVLARQDGAWQVVWRTLVPAA